MRGCHLRQVHWNKAQKHAQATTLKYSYNNQHCNSSRSCGQSASDQGKHCGGSQGLLASEPVGKIALCNGTDGSSKAEEGVDGTKYIGGVFEIRSARPRIKTEPVSVRLE